jgi:hypothetical protein
MHHLLCAIVLCLAAESLRATEYFVAVDGSDEAIGSMEAPFASLARGQQAAEPGDTVHVRGGLYRISPEQIAARRAAWAYVHLLYKSGAEGRPITYAAYRDERPVFDFQDITPRRRIHAFQVTGDWLQVVGLEIVGVQGVLTGHAQSACIENRGSHNRFVRLSMHDNEAIGFYGIEGREVLVVDCDAWNNYDPTAEDGRGGNTDGFGCHPQPGSTGWVFRRCRAWLNSDDGFDCINAHEAVTFEDCWALRNGFGTDMRPLADGNGFKAGGFAGTQVERMPAEIPRHVIVRCLAVRNKAAGFYANHHPGGCDWIANSAFHNGTNFNMRGRLADNVTEVPGYGHVLRDNLASASPRPLTHIDRAKCCLEGNVFAGSPSGPRLDDQDFQSLDEAGLTASRPSDGSLPATAFLHPLPGSLAEGKGAFAAVRGKP